MSPNPLLLAGPNYREEVMVMSVKSQRGVAPPPNEAQVDHMIPRVPGVPGASPGTNSFSNAMVLSRAENRSKSNK